MPELPSFKTMMECEDFLAVWWEDRKVRYLQAAALASTPMSRGKTLQDLTDMLGDHAEHLGWINEWLPDAEDLLQQAQACCSAEILASTPYNSKSFSATIFKLMIEGRIHNFENMARALERLSATITHRMEALRTLVSTAREQWKAEMNMPREAGRG